MLYLVGCPWSWNNTACRKTNLLNIIPADNRTDKTLHQSSTETDLRKRTNIEPLGRPAPCIFYDLGRP